MHLTGFEPSFLNSDGKQHATRPHTGFCKSCGWFLLIKMVVRSRCFIRLGLGLALMPEVPFQDSRHSTCIFTTKQHRFRIFKKKKNFINFRRGQISGIPEKRCWLGYREITRETFRSKQIEYKSVGKKDKAAGTSSTN